MSRGHAILQQRGLQLQAMVVPDHADPGMTLTRLTESGFTSVSVNSFDRSVNLTKYLGTAPGPMWGLWYNNGAPVLNAQESPYEPNLVSLQFHDELNVGLPAVIADAQATLADWRTRYPNVIGYLNHISSNSDVQLRNYMSIAKPDMMMFATYPFDGTTVGGSPTTLYVDLQRFRQLGLGGHDGTGQSPIPYAQYLQTFTYSALNGHLPSASEMQLNQFAGWTFGYTFATAFIYLDVPNESDFVPALFVGAGDAVPRQPAFNEIARINRHSRNLGPALVNLISTDVRLLMGQHVSVGQSVPNQRPAGVANWTPGAGGDAFLWAISATNVSSANGGLPGDVIVGRFRPLEGPTDQYFMVTNGLSAPSGTSRSAAQRLHLDFDFGATGVSSLLRLNRASGKVEVVPLQRQGGTHYSLDDFLDGGSGDLFKYNYGIPFVGGFHVDGGFVVAASQSLNVVDGDGTSLLTSSAASAANLRGLTNGNLLSRIGVDVWEVRDPQGNLVASRQLDNLGAFQDAVPTGGGGYAAVTQSNLVFMGADGLTPFAVVPNSVDLASPLNNGNIVGKIASSDIWRIYGPTGNVVSTRVLDNSGIFNDVAAVGEGGFAAISDSRIVFMAADGTTVRNVVTDSIGLATPLTNGNLLGYLGDDTWRLYADSGDIVATRMLDNFGTFLGAASLWDGGFAAYTDANVVFVDRDGMSVHAVVADSLDIGLGLASGNLVGRLAGTDVWRLYSPHGDILATKAIAGSAGLAEVAPLGLFSKPGEFSGDGIVNAADLQVWRGEFGVDGAASAPTGDATVDGRVDGADFLTWQRRFGGTSAVQLAVPELPSAALVWPAAGLLPWLVRRRLSLRRSASTPRVSQAKGSWRKTPQFAPRRIALAATAASALLSVCCNSAAALDRGHSILLENGLQLQAMIVPHSFEGQLDPIRFSESGFTGVSVNSFDRTLDLNERLGLREGMATGAWFYGGPHALTVAERSALSRLVSVQIGDEQDISDPKELSRAAEALEGWRMSAPRAISYLNQNGQRHTFDELRRFMSSAKPDMVMFDVYPFDGDPAGGRLRLYLSALARYRALAAGGHDGNGSVPIPAGLYLQTFTSAELNHHVPTPSEIRFNQFSAWAFGYKFACAFFYARLSDNADMTPILFTGPGDREPQTLAFAAVSETNRQSRCLGPTLVALRSTQVGVVPPKAGPFATAYDGPVTDESLQLWRPDNVKSGILRSVRLTSPSDRFRGIDLGVIVGHFQPLAGGSDDFVMLVNGLLASHDSQEDGERALHLEFDFGDAPNPKVHVLSRQTNGRPRPLALKRNEDGKWHAELTLDGGGGELLQLGAGPPVVSSTMLQENRSPTLTE